MTHPHASKKVLWVDDDPSFLEVGKIILENAGYCFLAAQDGQDALRIVQNESPQLILLDYSLYDMTGAEVFDLLVSQNDAVKGGAIPVIMLTGRRPSQTERRELLSRGLANYLLKPFGEHELLNVLDNELLITEIREHNRALIRELQQTKREIQETNSSILVALADLLKAKDPYTGEHSSAVLNFTEHVGRKLGVTEEAIDDLRLAALLHDIGKIGVPEAILCKPSRLEPEEKHIMDSHVVRGYEALAKIPRLKRVSQFVLHHHEWWDGGGYPSQIAGEHIPLESRIIAVVDAYDAMTSDRPYRKGLDQSTAVGRLQQAAGTQFDPQVVDCFMACLAEGLLGDRNIILPKL